MKERVRLRPDPGWIRDRKDLLRRVKAEVSSRLGEESADLKFHRRRYEREFAKQWRQSSQSELLSAIEKADLIFGGDFHASAQAQRTHLRILRGLSDERPVSLALECFSHASQKFLDAYLRGEITIDALKKKVRWDKSWGFPWEHYRPLLELAQRRGFRLHGLNEPPRSRLHAKIEEREMRAAKRIRRIFAASDGVLVYVVFGDLHLAAAGLPKMVRELQRKSQGRHREPIADLVIHLNSEKIYFDLAARGLELDVGVVRLSRNRFCVMSSPPWVQWQNYLLFLEKTGDAELEQDWEDTEEFDPTDQVASLIRLIASDLKLKSTVDLRMNDLAVYSSDDNQVWRRLEQKLKPAERAIARSWLAGGRSFYLPESGTGFLARPTVNHAASLAGQYLHAKLSRRRRMPWRIPGDFSGLIWTEAAGYFISKLVNHHRRSPTLAQLRAQLAIAGPGDRGFEALKIAMNRALAEWILIRQGRRRPFTVRARRKSSYYEAGRVLGGMMGERLYMAYRSRKLGAEEIIQLLGRDVTHKGFEREYEDILRRLAPFAKDAKDARTPGARRTRQERL